MRRAFVRRLAVAAAVVVGFGLVPVGTAAADSGHPVGGCATEGGWELVPADYQYYANYFVDYLHGNKDGYLCDKLPPGHDGNPNASFDDVIDNVIPLG